jgi:hypothetical protein
LIIGLLIPSARRGWDFDSWYFDRKILALANFACLLSLGVSLSNDRAAVRVRNNNAPLLRLAAIASDFVFE